MATLLGIDIGTTHCKVGLFEANGALLCGIVRPTTYDAGTLWTTVELAIAEITRKASPAAIGIASMAETGLLIDRRTGAARSPMLAWHNRCAEAQAARVAEESDALARFCRSGLRANAKMGLAKLLWLRDQSAGEWAADSSAAVWLSAADFIAYRLTGTLATDPTLAVRTYAYNMATGAWDADWLARWGLETALFPPVQASGAVVATTNRGVAGLAAGMPVVIAGHDHVCAAFAAGAVEPGVVLDSMGTAETLVGALADRPLDAGDYASGFIYGPHVVSGRMFWMSSLPASGGAIEWLRNLLCEPCLSYAQLTTLLENAGLEPTGILYYPYLSGSGAPHADERARAAFMGLHGGHTRGQLAKAVLEGTAYELEFIRRAAEQALGVNITTLIAAGGGVRNTAWLQIKADISGCSIALLPCADASLWGAAALAGRNCGIITGSLGTDASPSLYPDPARHQRYCELYERGYLASMASVMGQ